MPVGIAPRKYPTTAARTACCGVIRVGSRYVSSLYIIGAMAGHLAVINAGGWGTALSVLLGNAGNQVRLWCRRAALAEEIALHRENGVYLGGVRIPPSVRPTSSIADALDGAESVIFVP